MNAENPISKTRFVVPGLAILVLLGTLLRLSYPGVIEYKADEIYHFEMWKGVSERGEPWPAIGSLSSANMRNPGLSVWIYLVLGNIFHANSPITFNHYTQIANVFALLLLAFVARKAVKEDSSRAFWIGALALAAVNPMFVIQGRKMWHPAFMPLFSIVFYSAILNRGRPWMGAFLLGLFGVLMGQIHMSGFFFVAGVLAFLFFSGELKTLSFKRFFLGAAIGAIPMYTWLLWLFFDRPSEALTTSWLRLFMFRFWNFFLVDTWGVTMGNPLGQYFKEMIGMPHVFGYPTYLVAAAHLFLLTVGLYSLFKFLRPFFKRETRIQSYFRNAENDTSLVLRATVLGGGIGLTLSMAALQHHHLLVAYPATFLAFAFLIRNAFTKPRQARLVFALVFVSQLAISTATLRYLKTHGGAPLANYGVTYERQPRSSP